MAKTASKKSTKTVNLQDTLIHEYKDYLLKNGNRPHSVYQFTSSLTIEEVDFYKYFSSFESIDAEIWKSFIVQTIKGIKSDKVYAQYGAREKVLAFYYTLIEVLKKDRSYVSATFKRTHKPELVPTQLKLFKEEFDKYAKEIINEGETSEEIVKRPYISERYHDGMWLQLLFVIAFWLRDTSKDFERTDAAIEK